MKKRIRLRIPAAIMALLLLTAGLLAGCGGNPEDKSLKIGVLPDVDSIPILIAYANGYFEEEKIQVSVESFKSAADRESALQSGSIDGAVSDMLAAAFAVNGGFDVKITSLTNGSYKLLVGKDTGITDFEGLKGKSVAISQNTIIEYATDAMLAAKDMTPEAIEKTIIPQIPVRLEMLLNGQIDGATLPEPLATAALEGGASLLSSTDQLGINPGVLLFKTDVLKSRSQTVKAFYRAYNKAVDYITKEPLEKYISVIIEDGGFPETVKDSLVLPDYTAASLPDEEEFSQVMEWLTAKGLLNSAPDYAALTDGTFIK